MTEAAVYARYDASEEDLKLLEKVEGFKGVGQKALDEWGSKRKEGTAVWEGEFIGKPPTKSMYYPVVYGMLRPHVRAARRTYFSTPELTSVLPEGVIATEDESVISKIIQEEVNYELKRWKNLTTFVDDTFIQAEKIGICCAKARWVRTTEMEETIVDFPTFEFDENGEIIESPTVEQREVIKKNYCEIKYIHVDDLLWDETAREWDDVRWCIHQNIEYTEWELWDKVKNDGWNEKVVSAFIAKDRKGKNEAEPRETQIYKTAEFWGWIQPNDSEKEAKFMKICCDNDFGYVFFKGDNVYKYIDGEPMMPFQVGYLIRNEGQIIGESYCRRLRDIQGEINCIRNQRRRSVENDLNERYVMDKNADVEFVKFDKQGHGTIVMVDDIQKNFKEITHKDNTGSSYGELGESRQDLEMQTGSTPYVFGMVDPAITDTLGGIQLMSTASQAIIYDNILSYNETFMEPLVTKVTHLNLQYKTIEDLETIGIDVPEGLTREDLRKEFRLRIDTGQGATSEMVKLNNYSRAYFTVQQWVDYCDKQGLEPGRGRLVPLDLLREMLPLLNVKNLENLPSSQEVFAQTQAVVEKKIAEQQALQEQQQGQEELLAQNAGEEGFAEGMRSLAGQGQQGAPANA